MVTDAEAVRRVAQQTADLDAVKERRTVASIIAWLRSPDMDGRCHTHKIAQELERGDFEDWRSSLSESKAEP